MLLLLLYPKHVIKLSWYNLGCYRNPENQNKDTDLSGYKPMIFRTAQYKSNGN